MKLYKTIYKLSHFDPSDFCLGLVEIQVRVFEGLKHLTGTGKQAEEWDRRRKGTTDLFVGWLLNVPATG